MQDTEVLESFQAHGGPRKPQQRVIFLTDVVCTTKPFAEYPVIICAIGTVIEGHAKHSVLGFWTQDCLGARSDGRLHIQDASHILEIDTQQRFTGVAAAMSLQDSGAERRQWEESGEGGIPPVHSLSVVVVATGEGFMLRWEMQLDRDPERVYALQQRRSGPSKRLADVGKALQREQPWREIPSPMLLSSVDAPLHANTSYIALTDCNSMESKYTRQHSNGACIDSIDDIWTSGLLLSVSIEDLGVVVRDSKLSVVCRLLRPPFSGTGLSSPSKPDLAGGQADTPTAAALGCICDAPIAITAFACGQLCGWDISPCVFAETEHLDSDDFDVRLLQPVLLFTTTYDCEISTLSFAPHCSVSNLDQKSEGAPTKACECELLIGSRDGKLRLLNATWGPIHSPGAIMERYCADLLRKTRFLNVDSGGLVGTAGSESKVGPAPQFSCLPLSTSATGFENIYALATSQAIIFVRIPDLKVVEAIPLADAAGMASGAVKALSAVIVCEFATLLVSAFDKQMRIHFHSMKTPLAGAGAGAGDGDRVKVRVTTREPTGDRAHTSVGARNFAENDDVGRIVEIENASGLSLFITAADLSIIDAGNSSDSTKKAFVSPLYTKHFDAAGAGGIKNSSNPSPDKSRGGSKSTGNSWETPITDKKSGKVINQPIVFHSKIKSSGYGQAPNSALGKLEKRRRDRQRLSRSSTAPAISTTRLRQYPVNCEPISIYQAHNDFTASGSAGALQRVLYNGDGSQAGICAADSTVSTLRLPLSRYSGDGTFYMGHDSAITCISFSQQSQQDKQLLLSSSADGTARIWKQGKVDFSSVAFTHDCHSVSPHSTSAGSPFKRPSKSSRPPSRNRPFVGPIIESAFYYNDKFVTLANTNRVMLYSYVCDGADTKNDLKRLQSPGSYKRLHLWDFEETKSVSAFACVNSVLSPLLFASTSDRNLHILDAVRACVARKIETPHERPIHCIALPQPSMYAQIDQSVCNTFATSAMDNTISIWDLRAPTVSCRYSAHVNRREPVRCALSPCLRYLATGSEDKTARLIDRRTGEEVHRYSGARDVVSDVAFHPISAQLAACSYDGSIKFYCSADT